MANAYGMWDLLEQGWGLAGKFLKQARAPGEFSNVLAKAGRRATGIMMGDQNAGINSMYGNAMGAYTKAANTFGSVMDMTANSGRKAAVKSIARNSWGNAKSGAKAFFEGRSRSGSSISTGHATYGEANNVRAYARKTAAIGVGLGVGHHMLFNRHNRRDY